MLTLLAESKTMAAAQEPVSPQEFADHKPVLEAIADAIMLNMENMEPARIADILGISTQLAIKARNLAFDFQHKISGYEAIFAFTGEAYRGLDISSVPASALDNAKENLRIISSVYGYLKPSDIIKPYRCEFNKPIGPIHKTPIEIFKPKITVEIVNLIKEKNIKDIIDLLPGDADKCIDWKIVRAFASVNKVCFKIMSPHGSLKTPIASRLKELRGKMARLIITEGISSFKDLCAATSPDFIFSPQDSKPGLPIFISD